MDAILASGLGVLAGALILGAFFWWSRKKRAHWYAEKERKDTALVLVLVGLAFALLAIPVGKTYFLLWMFYSIAAGLIGYGYVQVVHARKAKQ